MLSVFDLFKIGIGPSSSHTVGPMRAAYDFLQHLTERLPEIQRVTITLYGSMAYTGRGHGTDRALLLGLQGYEPDSIDPAIINREVQTVQESKTLKLLGKQQIHFDPSSDIIFNYKDIIEFHSNAMSFCAYNNANEIIDTVIYFSIGGGFIIRENQSLEQTMQADQPTPYTFSSATELLALCAQHKLSIAKLMLANETATQNIADVKTKLLHIAQVMFASIERGCHTIGFLSGKLNVKRRAPQLYAKLLTLGKPDIDHPKRMSWLNVFAMAVNEENAAYGQVVTAPTNGAAGIVPAVLNYYRLFIPGANEQGIIDFLLTAAAIGILFKLNASISGAEVGCQGEVGVACSMAAAGFAAACGGDIYQIENAAEIAMEHNLGLTCDPVDGLVQIPCIERNAMGAVKAVNAAELALAEDGQHKISLDMVIKTMFEIGHNMNSIYKETSRGGLAVAVNVTEC